MPAFTASITSDDPSCWLGATPHIDIGHRRVLDTAKSLTVSSKTDRDKALALFDYVSRKIAFGFTRGFWDNAASDVLRKKLGYCNTKSTLFVALLRAVNIPARQVFVDIHSSILDGILDPGTPYVDHSYVEVFLNDGWRATDAYIVDPKLFAPARARVEREGRLLGYGVNANGSTRWNGYESSFSQFDIDAPGEISNRHFGYYADVADFYKRAEGTWNRLNPVLRMVVGATSGNANRKAEKIRQSE